MQDPFCFYSFPGLWRTSWWPTNLSCEIWLWQWTRLHCTGILTDQDAFLDGLQSVIVTYHWKVQDTVPIDMMSSFQLLRSTPLPVVSCGVCRGSPSMQPHPLWLRVNFVSQVLGLICNAMTAARTLPIYKKPLNGFRVNQWWSRWFKLCWVVSCLSLILMGFC